MNLQKYDQLAKNEASSINRNFRHVSIITNHKGHILAIGNNQFRTHPLNFKLGYRYPEILSELAAYQKLSYTDRQKKLYLFNYRFNKNLIVGMAKPCKYCLPWCVEIFDKIFYTTEEGLNIYE